MCHDGRQFVMGVMDAPSFASGIMFKLPFFALCFYTFNTATFGFSMMDAMLVPLMGVKVEMLPIVTGPVVDAMFLGYSVVNIVVAAFIYPYSFLTQVNTQKDLRTTLSSRAPSTAVINVRFFAIPSHPTPSHRTQETVKYQQLIGALFFFGFLPIMFLFLKVGLLGMMGVVPYGLMNTAFGVICLMNYNAL